MCNHTQDSVEQVVSSVNCEKSRQSARFRLFKRTRGNGEKSSKRFVIMTEKKIQARGDQRGPSDV